MIKVAILVDGGFYRKRAKYLFGEKNPKDRASELVTYCMRHLNQDGFYGNEPVILYRIFYYDCPPALKTVMHPLTQQNHDLGKSDINKWMTSFFEEIIPLIPKGLSVTIYTQVSDIEDEVNGLFTFDRK